ncbi:MAG: lipopolysaccharide export system protein LptA [bacterium]
MNLNLQLTCALLLTVSVLCTGSAQARESDLTQPIEVQADKSEFDERAGTQTLSGNVEITQGTMSITADNIAIALKDNALHSISGTGAPVRFQQETELGDVMKGEAESIIYDAIAGTLTLKGAATLSQPRQNLVSDLIVFDARTQKVNAEGGGKTGRVSIQILPPTEASSK